jgi:dihydroorotase
MKVPLAQALARVTLDPARVLGLNGGHLTEGHTADVCIFDPERYQMVNAAELKSQGKNTPFLGIELPGKVLFTLVQGQIAYDAGTA